MQPNSNEQKNKRSKPDWNFGIYFNAKKQKLIEQFEENKNLINDKNDEICNKNLFTNIGIFVNGFTIPTASELRVLMMKYGGEFHEYLNDRVTHIIAATLAKTKVAHMRNKTVVKPEWVIDSIKANKVLNINDYSLDVMNKLNKSQNKLNEFIDKSAKITDELLNKEEKVLDEAVDILDDDEPKKAHMNQSVVNTTVCNTKSTANTSTNHRNVDAKDENFLNAFYGKSRLHLISTLATDLKLYINNLRNHTIVKEIKQLPTEIYNKSAFVNLDKNERIVFHVDIDCFFVSVSLRDKPNLENEPVGIAHSKGKNVKNEENFSYSEIASCNYEARKYGIKNGMLVGTAKRLCPNIKLINYDFDAYSKCSKEIYELVSTYTHEIKAVSCDEMFIDFTDLIVKSNGTLNPLDLATFIRSEIKEKIRCPSSVGIGTNMLVARLATRKAKPNGQVWIRSGEETLKFLSKMEINTLPGIGSSIMSKISLKWNITTCEELRRISKLDLQGLFGNKLGNKLFEFCRGIDTRAFLEAETNASTIETNTNNENLFKKSVSTDVNYGIRFDTNEQVNDFFLRLSTELCDRLKRYNLKGTKLTLKVRIRDPSAPIETKKFLGCGVCIEKTISTPIHLPTHDVDIVSQCCLALYRQNFLLSTDCKDLRGIGLQMDKLKPATQSKLSPSKQTSSLFSIKTKIKEKVTDEIPLIILDSKEEKQVKFEKTGVSAVNNYENEYKLFKNKLKEILRKQRNTFVNDQLSRELTTEEIDCIKFILNDWIYWSSNLNRNDQSLFNNELNEFKSFLLYLVSFDEHLEALQKIMRFLKLLIITNGSNDWITYYQNVYYEIQAIFYEKYDATLDIDD